MIHLRLPDNSHRRLPFYLAMEEWAARRLPAADYFFTWRVSPTVIFGRNQRPDVELDREYCRAHGIQFYRRKSGGGCVYADLDNIMLSFITASADVESTFARYTAAVTDMLRRAGVDAHATGRNDIVIDGRKVSGAAFYRLPGRSIAHSTMLYSTDVEHMSRAITPSRSKLACKGVSSVESHITTLSRYLDMDIESFERFISDTLCDSVMLLSTDNVREIEQIERPYYDPAWIEGRRRQGTITRTRRVDGVGELAFELGFDRDRRIASINLTGDFFLTGDLDGLLERLKGCATDRDSLSRALADCRVPDVIRGLNRDTLAGLLAEVAAETI